ncbi:uncharacterized protein LOC121920284 [Sceloporus undulatus]|uniref:uncharacterized protein LOC121920284 n=1 Tax=Sceloporus undulatus TaxID=8520 RepID=UPI001C4D2EA5|nr:uncharacterized protein LOC121920284 [Sceloporus undulatus]
MQRRRRPRLTSCLLQLLGSSRVEEEVAQPAGGSGARRPGPCGDGREERPMGFPFASSAQGRDHPLLPTHKISTEERGRAPRPLAEERRASGGGWWRPRIAGLAGAGSSAPQAGASSDLRSRRRGGPSLRCGFQSLARTPLRRHLEAGKGPSLAAASKALCEDAPPETLEPARAAALPGSLLPKPPAWTPASGVRTFEIHPSPLPLLPCDLCPNGWIGYQRKCYYFSAAERNWTSSSLHCSSHNASLAVIDSQEEMSFLLRHKSPPDHWIGLRRDNPLQTWRWINGTISHEWLTVRGGGSCAYVDHEGIAGSSCTREEHWICSKPFHHSCFQPAKRMEELVSKVHDDEGGGGGGGDDDDHQTVSEVGIQSSILQSKMVETHESKEGWQHSYPLDSHAKENEIMNGSIQAENYEDEWARSESSDWKSISCLRSKKRKYILRRAILWVAVGSVILNLSLIIALSVRRCEICSASLHLLPGDFCPKGWIGFQRKCYYFSAAERNWTSSSLHCSSHNASLAVINSQEEMSFFLRYKSPPDHWIGLRRDNPLQPWKWINNTLLHEWFKIYGGGRCAYLNHEVIASSSCTREEHWICSKPAERWHPVTSTSPSSDFRVHESNY